VRIVDRVKLEAVPAFSARVRAEIKELRRQWRRRRRIFGGIMVAVSSAFLSIGIAAVVVPFIVFGAIFAIIAVVNLKPDSSPEGHPRLLAKIDFFDELIEMLRPELHARAPLAIAFDFGMYDEAGKLSRTAQSAAGRTKSYYTDRWLRLVVRLADGSYVRIVRHAGVKMKRGSVVRETRKLGLVLSPNAKLYERGANEEAMRTLLKKAVAKTFHNPPEGLALKLVPQGEDIVVRVLQDDADIFAKEVMALLFELMTQLATRRRPKQAYR
jgi:hypothetical protein